MKGPALAGSLILEDALTKIIHKEAKGYKREKQSGLIPRGNHSVFGDYHPDHAPNAFKTVIRKSSSTPSLQGSKGGSLGAFAGLGGAPRGVVAPPPAAGSTVKRVVVKSE